MFWGRLATILSVIGVGYSSSPAFLESAEPVAGELLFRTATAHVTLSYALS
jgi:hypothetical protein